MLPYRPEERKTMAGPHVVIVGGGLSGLSTAYFLSRKFSERSLPVRITVLEATDRFGGVLRTLSYEEFRIEAGADAFYAGRGETLDLCRALGLEPELVRAPSCFRRFYLLKDKKYYSLPGFSGSFSEVIISLKSPALGWGAKCRMLAEPFIPRRRGSGDESLGGFICRRLGRGFFQEIVEPLIRGVYMANPERLSLAAMFPRLREAERVYGSLAGSFIRKDLQKKRKAIGEFFTLKNGLESLVRALELHLKGCNLRASTAVRQCSYNQGWELCLGGGEKIGADVLCLAMNACDSAKLLLGAAPDLSRELGAIRYDSIATVNLIYRPEDLAAQDLDFGFLIPAYRGGVPFSSLKWLGKIPGGYGILLRGFISKTMMPEIFNKSDVALKREIPDYLREFMGIQAVPRFSGVERYSSALPQYETGHLERVTRVEEMTRRYPGLYLAGNGFHGLGITDCIRSAQAVADSIAGSVQTPSHPGCVRG